jgi:phosphatidylinositol alpha-mannosyltransferase
VSERVERVLLVSPYALSVPGGVQTQVRAMARELASRGLDVTACSPGARDDDLTSHGIAHVAVGRVVGVPANGSRAPVTFSPRAACTFAAIAATLRGGVVHVHEPFAPVAAYGILHAHRRPIVATFHRGGGGPAYLVGKPVFRLLSRSLDQAVAVSGFAASTIAAATGIHPEVLFNGIEADVIGAAVPTPTVAPTIVFVGRHEERKGLGVLLDALARLELPVECWVMGAGPQTEALKARFASDRRISWLGAVADHEKFARLRGADVLCVPSLGGESFGLVPLEGMAAGTAVVASDIDGYREATAGYAQLVAPNDPAALADALRDAIEHPGTAKALDAARAHAMGWSMTALVDQYLLRYERAAAGFVRTPARRNGGGPAR